MRLKQKVALLLTGIMMFSAVGIMNPTEAKAADATDTFTLTVPADTNITAIGWNNIGNVGVSNVSIEDGKKIEVTIDDGATGRTLKKTGDASKTVGYEIKKGTSASNEAFGDSIEFTVNGTQALGAVVSDFSSAAVGTYEDTINFTAELKSGEAAEYFSLEDTLPGDMAMILESNLVLNIGDTWEEAIELNAGKKIKFSLDFFEDEPPMEVELELGKFTIDGEEYIFLGRQNDDEEIELDFEPVFFITKGHIWTDDGYDFDEAYKVTDTIPEIAYLMVAAG